jgi:hypothetical protein
VNGTSRGTIPGVGNTDICPVCGYPDLYEPPWSEDEPSFEICPCCATQFGYDDACGQADPDAVRRRYQELREAWIAAGCQWFSKGRRAPPGWDAITQFANLDATRINDET